MDRGRGSPSWLDSVGRTPISGLAVAVGAEEDVSLVVLELAFEGAIRAEPGARDDECQTARRRDIGEACASGTRGMMRNAAPDVGGPAEIVARHGAVAAFQASLAET